MKAQIRIFVVACATVLASLSALAMTPANAATTPSTITITACSSGSPDTITVSVSSVSWTSPSDTLIVNNTACNLFGVILYTVSGSGETAVSGAAIGATGTTGALGSDVTAIRIRRSGPPTFPVLATLTATSPSTGGGGGGGDSSSSTTGSTQVVETLSLAVSTGGTTCTGGNPTGYAGSWLQLPAADACSQTGPNANPNAKLLGWATDPIFPVSVAQQIVDLKYGPIDGYFYGMRMIFIPAGGWTFVSGSNTLYPIWSSS